MKERMKKIYLIICMLFMFVPNVYAATVEKISDINNAPLIDGKKPIYIVNVNDISVTLNDTENFEVGSETNNYKKPIYVKKEVKKDVTFYNTHEYNIKNVGYYLDDNGNQVYLNAKIKILEISFGQDLAIRSMVSYVNKKGVWMHDGARGIHAKIQLSFYDSNNNAISESEFNKLYVQWKYTDIDIVSDETYTESIKFVSGFDNTFYVGENTYLKISEDNTRYTARIGTDEDVNWQITRSTVVGNQTSSVAIIEWWGKHCGTTIMPILTTVPTPDATAPVKSANKSVYAINEMVTYTVEQNFPNLDSDNAPKSIVLEDEFDSALDITKINVKVLNNDGTDVTSEWTKAVNKQKLTLTSNVKDKSTVKGKYQFIFSNVKVTTPDSAHETVVENNNTYKLIPNQTNLKMVDQDNKETTKESNIVKIKVKTSSIQLIKDIVSTVGENPQAGDIIKYKFTITNNGPVELSNITLKDIMTDIVFDDKIKSKLAPGETIEVYGHYVLKNTDISNKNVLKNIATVTGTTPDGQTISDTDDATVELVVLDNPKTGLKISLIAGLLIVSLSIILIAYKKGFKFKKNNTTNNE